MFGIGLSELIVIFFIIFLLFGAQALPEIARSLGEMMKMLKKEINGITGEVTNHSAPTKSPSKNEQDQSQEIKKDV